MKFGLVILTFTIAVFGLGCGIDQKNIIEGNWYYISSVDSSYNEIYFKGGKVANYFNDLGVGRISDYKVIDGDTLVISYMDNSPIKYKVLFEDSTVFLKGETNFLLHRLEEDFDYFQIPNTWEEVEKFNRNFEVRMYKYLMSKE